MMYHPLYTGAAVAAAAAAAVAAVVAVHWGARTYHLLDPYTLN